MKFLTILKLFNQLKKEGLFQDYAIGGRVAVNYYADVKDTIDLDLYFLIDDEGYSYLWRRLTSIGYRPKEHRVVIEGTPVDMFPVSIHPIYEEALRESRPIEIGDVRVKIFRPEYLIVTKLMAFRLRDKEDICDLLLFARINWTRLKDLVRRYDDKKNPLSKRLQEVLGLCK